jgi:hypothetical protein
MRKIGESGENRPDRLDAANRFCHPIDKNEFSPYGRTQVYRGWQGQPLLSDAPVPAKVPSNADLLMPSHVLPLAALQFSCNAASGKGAPTNRAAGGYQDDGPDD